MRPFRPITPYKGYNNLPKAKMARPFVPPPLTPAKAKPSIRPELTFQNKFTALADFPRLPCPAQPKLPKLLCPPQPKLINLRPTKPAVQEASSSFVQTKASYAMKAPESFAQAVKPELTKIIPTKAIPKEESFDFIISQTNVDRIQYLCKQIQVKGWVPKQPNAKVQEKAKPFKKLSKAALKQKLKEAMDNLDDYDEDQIMRIIEDTASTESSSEYNGHMCNPKGLALAYIEPDYK
ncbi:hypothetical protein KY290_004903 [Solanum tuberosum]|uniref:Uncharacterized protein n=1 Tax=Solanum tuberosum TaxID=4113 RepID=A0ABQ7WCK2_SOLTU|nr:hypothetical protein KY290_004903 [Solanum tuberosum]